ncbi:MAG: ykfB, partial [Ilumatobacteraceae bacterium]|nr:ykfB [Ilumatobacteraceae bacterium]
MGFDSTIVRIDTDDGLSGWGEMAPLGSFYDPSFVGGAREGLRILAPLAIGRDPRQHTTLTTLFDQQLNGHPYAKSALDMAAWDVTGRAAGMPLAELLGGRHADTVPLYRSVSQDSPQAMAQRAAKYVADGYRRIQVKVGLDPRQDIERMEAVLDVLPAGTVVYADANAAWTPADARIFVRATRHLDYVLEQPCAGHQANMTVRAACDRPFVLDESIDSLASLLRAHGDGLIDGITIKIARVGG